MNINELKEKLNKSGIGPRYYSVGITVDADRYIIYSSSNQWIVFYQDERGGRNEEKIFATESEACSYLYEKLLELSVR